MSSHSTEHPIRAYCHGIPCLIVNGRRVWSAPPPQERYGDDEPSANAALRAQ